jgi:hypothetical protein
LGRDPTLQENLPTKVGAQVLRHQLRVKTRSMNGFDCIINYGLSP